MPALIKRLEEGEKIDFITISGSGEPTLNTNIGKLIRLIKTVTDIPVAVITNGSLLGEGEVVEALMPADLVIPSLDAGDEEMFRYVNRPHKGLSFQKVMRGLTEFSRMYSGEIWLEVMLIAGVTGFPAEVKKIACCVEEIKPTKIQLNTVMRPPVEDFVLPLSYEDMVELAILFPRKVEIIRDEGMREMLNEVSANATEDDVMALLARRPCTIDDIARGLMISPQEGVKLISPLFKAGIVTVTRRQGSVYYVKAGHKK